MLNEKVASKVILQNITNMVHLVIIPRRQWKTKYRATGLPHFLKYIAKSEQRTRAHTDGGNALVVTIS
jgi:hypothetical protein